jgi:hypothetical protein
MNGNPRRVGITAEDIIVSEHQQKAESVTKQAAQAAQRRDPAPRHADGAAWGSHIKNADPSRKYVWVKEDAQEMGLDFYEELGYRREINEASGPRPVAGKTSKPGDFVMFRGHMLMSIERAEAEKIRKFGAPGAGHGLKAAADRDKRNNAKTRADLLQRVGGAEYMHVAANVVDEVKTTTGNI